MKLNPYPVLLTIGVLMFATVFFAQIGANGALIRAGAVSVNEDLSRLASKTLASLRNGGPSVAQEPTGRHVSSSDVRMAVLADESAAAEPSTEEGAL